MRVAHPPAKPLLIFDGECGFCRYWIGRWERATGERVDYEASQGPDIATRFPEIPREAFDRSVVLVTSDGRVCLGAEAVVRSLALAPGQEDWLWCYENLPGFAAISERAYRVVAANRPLFSWLTKRLFQE